ncbi:MAG: PQQ-dependent dehydrogenase, methanol/ethanol family [Gammaproteobacteria bacterium]|nr:PQQ-dependent dehydrogenase, methanol/ethanol family [Gammaproteobacteria bacterium]
MAKKCLPLLLFVAAFVTGCGASKDASDERVGTNESDVPASAAGPAVTLVDSKRLVGADNDASNWLTHGRTYNEQRFSPLAQINRDNVGELGLAWYFDVPTRRGMEATPIVVDGRMYVTGSWSIVYALNAATGEELWRYDPQVPKSWAQYACCDVVNRGVAAWGDNVFLGTLDGYLVAIDAATGEERWRTDTINRKAPYTITGAPRVVNGLVIIGNGGADYGVRGYVSAYDADNGDMRWRFYTVPGNPEDEFENETLEKAAATWNGEWWKYGGGGTVWDSMAYDAKLDLLYVGVGNGSPWNRNVRSPGGGDNLFLSSIVALRPSTGEYVWHYQTTPGDNWDFTATQHMILADMDIDGTTRKVLMQAPKNGFFYVLDRTNGELISAEPYVNLLWATHVDMATGRPVEVPEARYGEAPVLMAPVGLGGHNWHSMAFNPASNLVFIPAQDIALPYSEEPDFEFTEGFWNGGTEFESLQLPDDPAVAAGIMKTMSGQLVAWDPVAQREVWRYQHAGPWNGGALATAGELVFQGSSIGEFAAYDTDSGKRLWQFPAHTGIVAAPVSYGADDQQHVAIAAGWGSIFALLGGKGAAALGQTNHSRILAFSLAGDKALPAAELVAAAAIPEPPSSDASDAELALGKDLYHERCGVCHGTGAVSGGVLPDLRRLTKEKHEIWDAIVVDGALRDIGMPAFGQILSKEDSAAVQAFVIERARFAYNAQHAQQN